MSDTITVRLFPYLIAACSRNPKCRDYIDKAYRKKGKEYEQAARQSDFWNNNVMSMGGIEASVYAKYVLGYISIEDSKGVENIVNAGWSEILTDFKNNEESNIIQLTIRYQKKHPMIQLTSSEKFDIAIVFVVLLNALGVHECPDEAGEKARKNIMEYFTSINAILNFPKSSVAKSTMRKMFGKHSSYELSYFLEDDNADSQAFRRGLLSGGIDINFYMQNILLSEQEVAQAYMQDDMTKNEVCMTALGYLFAKCIQRDREYAEKFINESSTTTIKHLKAELAEQKSLNDSSDKRYATVVQERDAAVQRAEMLQRKLDALKEQMESLEADRQEIASLRTALYDAQSQDTEPLKEEDSRSIPERLLIVGGMPQWQRAMKEQLSSATFLTPDQANTADPSLVKNASELWIEPSVMSHKAYYRMCNLARLYSVSIKYFAGRNVNNCLSEIRHK